MSLYAERQRCYTLTQCFDQRHIDVCTRIVATNDASYGME